ncbi:MAG: HDIG domain-containing protein [Clostridiales bacterium]|nr:HDIG domain-containing protein [Clostridiales bacterium]
MSDSTEAPPVGQVSTTVWWRKKRYRVLLPVVAIVLIVMPLVVQAPPIGVTEGEPAQRTFRANRTVQFVDEPATALARQAAADSVEPVYVFDAQVLAEARGDVAAYFDAVRTTRPAMAENDTATVAALVTSLRGYDAEWTETLLTTDDATFGRAARAAEQLVTTVLSRRFSADELDAVIQQLTESAESLEFTAPVRAAIKGVATRSVQPTLKLDDAATAAARAAAADGADPVVIVKQAGENIVQQGEIVNSEHLEIIRRLGLLDQGGSVSSLLALFFLATMAVGTCAAYVWRFERRVFERVRDLLLVTVLVAGAIWVTRTILWLFPEISLFLLPVPLAAILATLLVNSRIGLLTGLLSTIGGVLLGFSEGASAVAMLVWSVSSVVAVSFMTERRRLFYVGMFLVAAGAFIGAVASLAAGEPTREAISAAGNGALGGMFAAVLGYGLLPFFEYAFGVTTDVRLLELASPSHPLMRRLMLEAPGTYNHSVFAGTLAESAAEEIGARGLLARVGAYYHDVGKLSRPSFFVENQSGSGNPHDSTAPGLSALIITAHVREGVKLAEENRLPAEVVEIIEQHHGDSLVTYFYDKAASESGAAVPEEDFRYRSARPQSREAALVMLADGAEAAVRALDKPSVPRIQAAVRSIVDAKVADGQLHDSDLTLADIDKVVAVYSKLLAAVYHPRVEYPETIPRRSVHAHRYHES